MVDTLECEDVVVVCELVLVPDFDVDEVLETLEELDVVVDREDVAVEVEE